MHKKEAKEGKCIQTIYFQLTGNKVANNTFENDGTSGMSYASNILLQGGIFPHEGYESTNDCAIGNKYPTGGVEYPTGLEGTWGCQNLTTPPPKTGGGAIFYVEELSEQSKLDRHPKDYAAPPAQPSMPEPCEGVPLKNPLCESAGGGHY